MRICQISETQTRTLFFHGQHIILRKGTCQTPCVRCDRQKNPSRRRGREEKLWVIEGLEEQAMV